MKIYTKTGDDGTTGLYGGERVHKNAPRVSAYGSVDEANAAIGLARAHLEDLEIDETLEKIQNALFDLGADLATPTDSKYRAKLSPIDVHDIAQLEQLIDYYDDGMQPLKTFILPGGHLAAGALHVARTVTRRAERELIHLAALEEINQQTIVYLNRLSDLLFVLARVVNMQHGVSEVRWQVKGRERKEA